MSDALDLKELREKVAALEVALRDLVESKAIQEAPFINYSEAFARAKDVLGRYCDYTKKL